MPAFDKADVIILKLNEGEDDEAIRTVICSPTDGDFKLRPSFSAAAEP
jgi:hypothetical protein